MSRERKPGDVFLDRYMPNATDAEREEARRNLQHLARALNRIEDRLAREWYAKQIRERAEGAVESEIRIPP